MLVLEIALGVILGVIGLRILVFLGSVVLESMEEEPAAWGIIFVAIIVVGITYVACPDSKTFDQAFGEELMVFTPFILVYLVTDAYRKRRGIFKRLRKPEKPSP
jgi:hypothetical protein